MKFTNQNVKKSYSFTENKSLSVQLHGAHASQTSDLDKPQI